jgi:hypothetical protein
MPGTLDSDRLKKKLKAAADNTPDHWRTRLHRAISWVRRAEVESADEDARFIFLWIAFNAAYAREFGPDENERSRLGGFIDTLLKLDEGKRLAALTFQQFTGPIRVLIQNKYVFEPFWRALREHDSSKRWEEKFSSSRKVALDAVMKGDTSTVLSIAFDRLYVLRNQLVHGGATWSSSVNRQQVRDGAAIMGRIVPLVIELMLDHPQTDFGEIQYPVV